MITVFSNDHVLHHPVQEYYNGTLVAPFETPLRVVIIYDAIVRSGLGTIVPPREFTLEPLYAVHTRDYLDYIAHAYDQWVAAGGTGVGVLPDTFATHLLRRPPQNPRGLPGYYAFDLCAPIVAGTYQAARSAANVALTGATLLLEGHRTVYALCRPPGHHAGVAMHGGYCFLNNAAIAAKYLLRTRLPAPGSLGERMRRIAILDIDFHHGNGTQQIFYMSREVLFISIHADPARQYPYFSGYADERGTEEGLGYTLNIPLEAGVTDQEYLRVLEHTLAVIADFAPKYLVLSAGFDTFGGDPIGDFALTEKAFPTIGRRIAALGVPTLIVQEGGYAVEALGTNVIGLLSGFE